MRFTEVSEDSGIVASYRQAEGLKLGDGGYEWMTAGAVAEDFDGDGWVDIYIISGGVDPSSMYRNLGDGSFSEEARERGVDLLGLMVGAAAADYDSDGDVDIYVSSIQSPHYLLKNDGYGYFEVESVPHLPGRYATSPSWGDINNDGLLDMALGAWILGEEDIVVFMNAGGGELVYSQGLAKSWNFTPIFADLNNDRYQDLVAVADIGEAGWFFNTGNGILVPGANSDIEFGMGGAAGDIDNDGDLDIFMTSIYDEEDTESSSPSSGNRLLLNDGQGRFTDVTGASGVREGDWGWGALMGDLDNDGDMDIFHVNGWQDTRGSNGTTRFSGQPARLFENLGENRFEENAASAGIADTGQGRTVLPFDYDNDGDLDIFITNHYERMQMANGEIRIEAGRARLYRNDSSGGNHWLKVNLVGSGAPHHSHGIGARVTVKTSLGEQLRELNASSGFNGHGPNRIAHFGLGALDKVDEIEVVWTTGDRSILKNVASNQDVVVASPAGVLSSRKIQVGEPLRLAYPLDTIGNEVAIWTVEDVEYPSEAVVIFMESGASSVRVQIYGGEATQTLVRTEVYPVTVSEAQEQEQSIARVWNEVALDAIRIDFPNPAVHARNLFHLSIAMWDAWAAYDPVAEGYLVSEKQSAPDVSQARREAISHAAYRLLFSRYQHSVNASTSLAMLRQRMTSLGYPTNVKQTESFTPASLGNRIAQAIIDWSADDGSGEESGYADVSYNPANDPLQISGRGTSLADPNRWQPLEFEEAMTQNGLVTSNVQIYQGSQWGWVRPFALPSNEAGLPIDPGPPPYWGTPSEEAYIAGSVEVLRCSSWLDPGEEVMIDISPASRGLNSLGTNDGNGHGDRANPATGQPYAQQFVRRADFCRVVAEYWADGPDSETPPGHWNKIANSVSDHPAQRRLYTGTGSELDPLEWDVKLYFMLNGALHDAAVAAWGCKRYYDYVRPISSIRYLGKIGRLPEIPGLIERITAASSAPSQRHFALLENGGRIGDTAVFAWAGEPENPQSEYSGNRWILASDWLPYQRDTFVTPAFAGYVSGHSTFSRAAAEVLTYVTGSPYFPGGLATYTVPEGGLEFEFGPTSAVTLQWARYYDAADEAGLSRLFGGIHVPADDGPGRILGAQAGWAAIEEAEPYFNGTVLQTAEGPVVEFNEDGWLLQIDGIPGRRFQIQASTDLQQWFPLGGVLPMDEPTVRVPIEGFAGDRYYRVLYSEAEEAY